MIDYIALMKFYENHSGAKKLVLFLNRFITVAVYISYFIFLGIAYYLKSEHLLKYIFVPAILFVLVSVFRYLYNAPRPYEVQDFTPVYNKKTVGKSFPSRHVFSAFIIALMIFDFCVPVGIIFLCLSVILAITRVMCGVHFIKDVISYYNITDKKEKERFRGVLKHIKNRKTWKPISKNYKF